MIKRTTSCTIATPSLALRLTATLFLFRLIDKKYADSPSDVNGGPHATLLHHVST
jgi:hypothetical protein